MSEGDTHKNIRIDISGLQFLFNTEEILINLEILVLFFVVLTYIVHCQRNVYSLTVVLPYPLTANRCPFSVFGHQHLLSSTFVHLFFDILVYASI